MRRYENGKYGYSSRQTARNSVTAECETSGQDYFRLGNSYPNPFFAVNKLPFMLTTSGYVRLELLDANNRKLHTLISKRMIAGKHTACIDNDLLQLPPGYYVYEFQFAANDRSFVMRERIMIG